MAMTPSSRNPEGSAMRGLYLIKEIIVTRTTRPQPSSFFLWPRVTFATLDGLDLSDAHFPSLQKSDALFSGSDGRIQFSAIEPVEYEVSLHSGERITKDKTIVGSGNAQECIIEVS